MAGLREQESLDPLTNSALPASLDDGEQLCRLVTSLTPQELVALKTRLENPREFCVHLSQYLPDALKLSLAQSERLATVMAPLITEELFEIIKRLNTSGITIVLVEQNAHAALNIGTRGYVVETGRIVLDGAARELLENS